MPGGPPCRLVEGKVYYIGPNDITLFQGAVTDSLEAVANKDSREALIAKLFRTVMHEALDKGRLPEVQTAPAVEIAVRKKINGGGTLLYLLNHDAGVVENTRVIVPLDGKIKTASLELYQPGSACQKLSGKVVKAGTERCLEFEIPAIKDFAAVWIK